MRLRDEENRRMWHGEDLYTIYHSSEKTIAILGDSWSPQTAKQGNDDTSKTFL